MKKKVLVVDDDSFARTRMKGFLRSFPCTVLEAEDGVQALALIATESPDLVLLDVNMPVLDGLQTLREIRSSTTHSRLPVVSVFTHAERAMVMRLIDLGIAGFLVKPLKPDDTMKRLEALFRSPKTAIESGETAAAGQRLLLVDHDPNFRELARSLLNNHFEILEAATGAVGLQLFREHEPRVVCMSDNLQLLGTRVLVRMIRETPSRFPPRLYLLAETEEVADPQRLPFDGVLHKSLAPDAFDRELHRTLLAGESASGTIASLVRGKLRAELVSRSGC